MDLRLAMPIFAAAACNTARASCAKAGVVANEAATARSQNRCAMIPSQSVFARRYNLSCLAIIYRVSQQTYWRKAGFVKNYGFSASGADSARRQLGGPSKVCRERRTSPAAQASRLGGNLKNMKAPTRQVEIKAALNKIVSIAIVICGAHQIPEADFPARNIRPGEAHVALALMWAVIHRDEAALAVSALPAPRQKTCRG